ncbi:MAG TPA: hypothetical protein VI968_01830 [archaeon]|nr:hypothetical protein [archaeon]
MLAEILYWLSKMYFMIMPLYYLYTIFVTKDTNTFIHVTGIIGILFLLSNIIWYGKGGR